MCVGGKKREGRGWILDYSGMTDGVGITEESGDYDLFRGSLTLGFMV